MYSMHPELHYEREARTKKKITIFMACVTRDRSKQPEICFRREGGRNRYRKFWNTFLILQYQIFFNKVTPIKKPVWNQGNKIHWFNDLMNNFAPEFAITFAKSYKYFRYIYFCKLWVTNFEVCFWREGGQNRYSKFWNTFLILQYQIFIKHNSSISNEIYQLFISNKKTKSLFCLCI